MSTITEGIKYIGSKNRLMAYIIDTVLAFNNVSTVFDGFSGTTRVGQALRRNNYVVYSNDLSDYSYTFGKCFLEVSDPKLIIKAKNIIDYLNTIKGHEGFITKHYSGGSSSIKNGEVIKNDIMFWQKKNTLKADAIRKEIDNYRSNTCLYYILLTSLIFALDKVDNTVGVQQAFLKNSWSKRSFNDLTLTMPNIPVDFKPGRVFKSDTNELVKNIEVDIAYYDPPYTSHNYASYYHIWDTIVKNDNPEMSGIINRRKKVNTSLYNSKRFVYKAFSQLIKDTNSKYILISYNNEGLLLFDDLMHIASKKGEVLINEIDYKRNVMSQIGICDKHGKIVGNPGKKNNIEYLISIIVES